jgi:hypothetical protein
MRLEDALDSWRVIWGDRTPLAASATLTAPGLNRDRATGGAFRLVSGTNSRHRWRERVPEVSRSVFLGLHWRVAKLIGLQQNVARGEVAPICSEHRLVELPSSCGSAWVTGRRPGRCDEESECRSARLT